MTKTAARNTPVAAQLSEQEQIDLIVAQIEASRSSSGVELTERLTTLATNTAASLTTATSRIIAGFVAGFANAGVEYHAERARQTRYTAERILRLSRNL